MMSPAQSFAKIAELLEQAMEPDADARTVHALISAAHTHAVIQGVHTRRAEARALFAKFPEIESRPQ